MRPKFIVGLGGSAGGLRSFKLFLDALPSETGMAFVIISHHHPAANSQLARILARHTKMPVIVPATGMVILTNHVYVIPANADLYLESETYTFTVVSPRKSRNNQIDLFLTSLSEAMTTHAIGIIFSGFDGDGTDGCREIKARGGITLAQDKTAEMKGMPCSAQEGGVIDFVLPPDKMANQLQLIANSTIQ